MVTYKLEQVQRLFKLLNGLEISGIENARRIAVISEILNNPEEKGDGRDGGNNEEV